MNATQIHLALTHVPVILSFVGLILFIVSLFRNNDTLIKTALYVLLAAGLFTIPVYLTGEGTEHLVEDLPGVSEPIIERHEDIAQLALILVSTGGLLALAGLLFFSRPLLFRVIRIAVFIAAFSSAAAMAQTAHLGGQIRHTEIRSGSIAQTGAAGEQGAENGTQAGQNGGTEEEDDD